MESLLDNPPKNYSLRLSRSARLVEDHTMLRPRRDLLTLLGAVATQL